MTIILPRDSYSGVDGSSLSPTRCDQIIQVYEMLEKLGNKTTTYVGIQDEAAEKKLFGSTQARSAIRTFFPLLKKIGFVDYDGVFAANQCFTKLGTQFVMACRALNNVTDKTPNKEEIVKRLLSIKKNAQCQGLINMYNDPEWEEHNIWIALRLLKELRIIHWNEFLYTLHCIDQGKDINDAINDIKNKKKKIDSIEFVNEKKENLPNTCYSYIRSFLEESGLIMKVSSLESKLSEESDLFYSQINM